MVCKEDVITWFKEAASYRRIDVMCSLLNMCIPFELRYLGTCIEEQGKHDFQELRGAALIANSTDRLAKEFASFKGLLDKCTRHRLTVYISLLQSRNYHCANWMYDTLLRTDTCDSFFSSANLNKDVHTELLLLFTLALNHPAFTFEQKQYFGTIVTRLAEPELPLQQPHNPPPCPPGLGYTIKPPLPVHHIPLGVTKAPSHGDAPLPPPGIPLPAVHSEFVGGPQSMWSRTHFMNTGCGAPAPPPELAAFPPPISPLVSQQSSPTASRSVSPSRMYPCRPHPHPPPIPAIVPHMDRLPPPPPPLKDSIVLPAPQYNTDLKTVPIDEVNHADSSDKNPQQQWMESVMLGGKVPNGLLGGVPVAVAAAKCPAMYLSGELQTLSLDGDVPPHRCTSSSGSSQSSECQSPPDTPTESAVTPPHGPGRGLRNGGAGSATSGGAASVPPPGLSAPADGSSSALFTSSCNVPYTSQFPVPPPPPASTFHSRSLFYSQAYRPQFPAYQQNGELPYLFPHYLPMMYSSATVPPPKVTCYNCGLPGHLGADCKDPTIEEITQKKGYQLDYTSPPPDAPPPTADKPPQQQQQPPPQQQQQQPQ